MLKYFFHFIIVILTHRNPKVPRMGHCWRCAVLANYIRLSAFAARPQHAFGRLWVTTKFDTTHRDTVDNIPIIYRLFNVVFRRRYDTVASTYDSKSTTSRRDMDVVSTLKQRSVPIGLGGLDFSAKIDPPKSMQ